jgi:hypothetical protein
MLFNVKLAILVRPLAATQRRALNRFGPYATPPLLQGLVPGEAWLEMMF